MRDVPVLTVSDRFGANLLNVKAAEIVGESTEGIPEKVNFSESAEKSFAI